MKNAKKLLLGLCAVALFGCGGNGNGQAFVGSYVGTWVDPTTTATGALNLTVDGNAHVAGTIASTSFGTGTITGTIFATGWMNTNVTFPGTTTTMHIEGSIVYKDPSSASTSGISGTLTETVASTNSTINVDADRP